MISKIKNKYDVKSMILDLWDLARFLLVSIIDRILKIKHRENHNFEWLNRSLISHNSGACP